MGSIFCSAIIDKAEIQLLDSSNDRFDAADLFGWLKSGQREIVLLKPDANVINEAVQLIAGTKQSIPTGGFQLIDIVRNMGPTKIIPGNVPILTDRMKFDQYNLSWHTETADATVQLWFFDERDPKNFYVSPPQPAVSPGSVEQIYSKIPTDPVAIGNVITLDDIYETVLLDYILYRAYGMGGSAVYSIQKAASYWSAFVSALGRRDLIEKMDDPNVQE